MKRVFVFLLLLSLCLTAVSAYGDMVLPEEPLTDGEKMLLDQANLLTETEERVLLNKLQTLSQKHNTQFAVITLSTLDGQNIAEVTNALYDTWNYGYGANRSGVILVIAMDVREYYILSNGTAGDAITETEIETISDAIVEELSDYRFEEAFNRFAEECDRCMTVFFQGEPFAFGHNLFVGLVIGLIVSGVVMLIFYGQLKSVQNQDQANAYIRSGSFQLTQSGDYFMYRNITRTPIPRDTSSGGRSGGSGGGSRHGGGGRF